MDNVKFIYDLVSNSLFLPVVFSAVIFVFVITSSIYMYHWRKYAINKKQIRKAQSIYFSVSAVFIIGAVVSLMAI